MADKQAYPGKIWREGKQPSVSPYVGQVVRAVSAFHSVLVDLANEKKIAQAKNFFSVILTKS